MSYKSRKRKSENRKNIQLFYNLVKRQNRFFGKLCNRTNKNFWKCAIIVI